MVTREDKENTVWSSSNAPVTPTHLLSRSQPSFLKDVKKSPQRREASRRPLASKDNNRTASFLTQKEPLHKKRVRPAVNHAGSFIGPARLAHVPSLHTTGAPRLKSLVLRDSVAEGPKEHSDESDGIDELDPNSIAAKLREKLAARDENLLGREQDEQDTEKDDMEAQSGLLGRLQGTNGGLQGLQGLLGAKPELGPAYKHSHSDSDSDSDREVETIPPRPEPLPYVPSAYTPFTNEDIEKLRSPAAPTLRLHFSDDEENQDDGLTHDANAKSKASQLLDLKFDFSDDDEEDGSNHERKRYHGPGDSLLRSHLPPQHEEDDNDAFELEPSYGGEGLTVKELESLLE
ncbi:LAME_0G08724g1_1 [Lachancea meyersii CBS 8951]|uniref:LAME_0G08724g1_1 n=1 Tax=Lachancea meyersii CBS 8951 TaxID=1266667 RepID=A0A1G4K8G9_9SACH|nr:LAME_0G08724g1_1 [Lachancea meyersii CBS 8951]